MMFTVDIKDLQKFFEKYPYLSFLNVSFQYEKRAWNYILLNIFQKLFFVWISYGYKRIRTKGF